MQCLVGLEPPIVQRPVCPRVGTLKLLWSRRFDDDVWREGEGGGDNDNDNDGHE